MDKILLLVKKALEVFKEQGLTAAANKIKWKITKEFKRLGIFKPINAVEIALGLGRNINPLHTVAVQRAVKRINIFCDSLSPKSMLEGAGAAIIIAGKLAVKNSMGLRIITRDAPNDPAAYFELIKKQKIEKPANLEFYSDFGGKKNDSILKLEVSANDIFMATSWWTAHVIGNICLDRRFFYIVQGQELGFHPDNDERLMCENILKAENIDFIVNSAELMNRFKSLGRKNIAGNGCVFDPAFPVHLFKPSKQGFSKKEKYSLCFYGKPGNPGDLFRTGLKYLDDAVNAGIIDMDKWDVIMDKANLKPFVFSSGKSPVFTASLPAADLAFCLMYAPQPGMNPVEPASSGAVVLANRHDYGSYGGYCGNIIESALEKRAMLEGFDKAVRLAMDGAKREANFAGSGICRSWDASAAQVNDFFLEKTKK